MRKYIRHPSDIPIEIDQQESGVQATESLMNVSLGGLSFHSKEPLQKGKILKVRIPFVDPPFETLAKVAWCEANVNYFDIGVELLDKDDAYKARMVEQICHIEHYKREVLDTEGRQLTGTEAAAEWINKYAHVFPRIDEIESV